MRSNEERIKCLLNHCPSGGAYFVNGYRKGIELSAKVAAVADARELVLTEELEEHRRVLKLIKKFFSGAIGWHAIVDPLEDEETTIGDIVNTLLEKGT